jgi:hypothetical protein
MASIKGSLWSRSLDKLKGALLHAEPEAAAVTKKKAGAKKAEAKKAEAKKQEPKKAGQPPRPATAGSSASVAADPAAGVPPPEEKTPKKKIPVQPWYRHRQRW